MAVDAALDFDAASEGASLSVSSPWSTSGTVPVTRAASAKNGARGIYYSSTNSAGRVMYDFGSNQTARAVVLGNWLRLTTLSTGNFYPNAIYSLTTGGTNLADWRVNPTTNTITLRNASSASGQPTSTTAIAINTWYWTEWKLDDPANTQTLRIYSATGTLLESISGSYTGTTTRVPYFGPYVAAATGVLDMDDLTVASDWIGPVGVPTRGTPKTSATSWDVLARDTKTSATSWDVLARDTKTSATSWDVASRVQKTSATTWDVLSRATPKTSATSWDVFSRVAKTSATSWDTAGSLTRVFKTSATSWDVAGRVSKTLLVSWDVQARAVKTSATTWQVLTRATPKTSTTSWDVRARVNRVLFTSWNVAGPGAPVAATFSEWDGTTEHTLTATWWDGTTERPITVEVV